LRANPSGPAESRLGWVVFIAAVALQVLSLPFLAAMIFFGALGLPHYSPSDKLLFLMFAAYLPAFPLAAIVARRFLRRQEPLAATAIVLSPILLLVPTFAVTVLSIFPGLLGGGAGP
jgi:hypothetical protein